MIAQFLLQTDRLVLRTPREDDYGSVSTFMQSPRSSFVGGPVTDEWNRWRGFLAAIGHWGLKGYGFFMVALKDGTPVGRAGIINHVMWDEPELGWHLFDGFEGQGYATEAAQAVRDWAWRAHGLGPLVSNIHPDNRGSIRVAERLGARLEREATLLGAPCLVFRHPEPYAEAAA